MVKNHLKRLNAPKSWPIKKKEAIWIIRPNPGAHELANSIPLTIALRDLLKHAKTTREVKHIVYNKEVLIDGKRRKDLAYPVGLMDVISIPEIKENHRLLFNKKGKISAVKIDDKESKIKVCKIRQKKLSKGKTQLNTTDGRNILVEKDTYKVGDSVVIEFEKQKIIQHLKLEKGALIYLTGGKHIGSVGKIETIDNKKIIFKTKENDVYETLKKFAFVIGEEKAVITIEK